MGKLKIATTVLCLCCLFSIALSACPRTKSGACPRCTDAIDTVWAIDGENCRVFRNPCFLATENCERASCGEPELKPSTSEICQKKCKRVCTKEYNPICAEFKGVYKTHSNPCVLDAHICETGETYQILYEGECY